MDFAPLEKKLSYHFVDRGVLLLALTHKSFGHESYPDRSVSQRDNERLEFLGDSILGVVVSDLLLETFPHATEGDLSKMRAAVVNEKTLAMIAKSLDLQSHIRLGKGEMQSFGQGKSSILSSAFEAVVAAIYLDGGFQVVTEIVRSIFTPLFQEDHSYSFCDHKTQLQEWVQSRWKMSPSYHLLRSTGPDHAKIFEIEVRLGGKKLAVAQGTSKKEAEQSAAQAAILSVQG